jgi:phage major head subunit gpT-like protein
MDINNPAALARLREDWKVRTFKAFHEGAMSVSDRICQKETSSNAVNVYDLLVQLPVMKRFGGQVQKQNMARAQHRIENAEFETTIAVKQADVERDNIGQYNNKFDMLGISGRRRPDRYLAELMIAAFSTVDYTGTNFFAANKPHIPGVIDAGTFTNLMTEKPSAASWEKAKQLIGNILDANGEPMGLGGNLTVVCSQKWESTFKRILNAELIMQVGGANQAAAVTNIYKGDAELIKFPYLNTAAREDKWFVLDTSFPLRAFIDQEETKPRFYVQDNPNTHKDAFDQHVFLYQLYVRGEMGFGLPQLAVGSTGADAAL